MAAADELELTFEDAEIKRIVRKDLSSRYPISESIEEDLPPYLIALEKSLEIIERYKIPQPKSYVVRLPAWDEIVHLPGSQTLTDGDLALVREVKKAYSEEKATEIIAAQLGENKLRQLYLRTERFKAMFRSPTPRVVQDIGAILTQIDNVQDGLVTLLYLIRISYPLFRRIAPRAAAKALPVIGVVSTAADILNLIQLIGSIGTSRFPGKRSLVQAFETALRARGVKVLSPQKIRDFLPSAAEAVQIAQTTDTLFGVGLSLGPVLGLVQDSISGLVRSNVPGGGEVRIDGSAWLDPAIQYAAWAVSHTFDIEQSPRRRLARKPASIFDVAAMRILSAAFGVLQHADVLPRRDVVMTLTAVHAAVTALAESNFVDSFTSDVAVAAKLLQSPIKLSESNKAFFLSTDEFLIRKSSDPVFAAQSPSMPLYYTQAFGAPLVTEAINRFIEADPLSAESQLAGHIINAITIPLLRLSGGPQIEVKSTLRPEFAAPLAIVHQNLHSLLPPDSARLANVLNAVTGYIIDHQGSWPPYSYVRSLFDIL